MARKEKNRRNRDRNEEEMKRLNERNQDLIHKIHEFIKIFIL